MFSSSRSKYSGLFTSSTSNMGLIIDTGIHFVNRIIDAFLIFALVAAARVVALEAYNCLNRGHVSKDKLKPLFKKMCSEGAYWGIIVGMYVGLDYGVQIILSAGDWKNAMLRGVLTGALVSAAYNDGKDKVVQNAVTGGAIAIGAELLCYLK